MALEEGLETKLRQPMGSLEDPEASTWAAPGAASSGSQTLAATSRGAVSDKEFDLGKSPSTFPFLSTLPRP